MYVESRKKFLFEINGQLKIYNLKYCFYCDKIHPINNFHPNGLCLNCVEDIEEVEYLLSIDCTYKLHRCNFCGKWKLHKHFAKNISNKSVFIETGYYCKRCNDIVLSKVCDKEENWVSNIDLNRSLNKYNLRRCSYCSKIKSKGLFDKRVGSSGYSTRCQDCMRAICGLYNQGITVHNTPSKEYMQHFRIYSITRQVRISIRNHNKQHK